MKKILILLIFLVCSGLTYSQTATATIGDYTQSPGTLTVPVTVTNFTGIGALTIFFEYDPAVVTFTSYNTPGLAGLEANGSYWPSLGKYLVGITWSSATGANSASLLVNVVFNYLGGAGNFTFVPSMSEVTYPSGLPLTVLYDNGSISPVTSASATLPQLLNQTPNANFFIPLIVNFSTVSGGVNNFTFVVQYDEAKLDFTSLENLAWTGIVATELTNPTGRVAIEWSDPSGDGKLLNGKLVDLKFNYIGGTSALTFQQELCEVTSHAGSSVPTSYTDGQVTQDPASVVTVTAGNTTAIPGNTALVPVTVSNFSNIGAFDLLIDFNQAVVSYVELVNINPLLPTATLLTNATATGVGINWTAAGTALSITNGEKLFDIKFNYAAGTTALTFDQLQSDISDFTTLNPKTVTYVDGSVTESLVTAAATIPVVLANPLTTVEVPITVDDFTNLGAFDLAVGYDITALTFVGLTSVNPQLSGGSIASNATNGKVYIGWNIDPSATIGVDITNGEALFNIQFNYNAGTSPITFDQTLCEVTKFDDRRVNVTYTDGEVSGGSELSLKLFLEGLYNPLTGTLRKAQDFVGGTITNKFQGDTADVVNIELHDASDYSRIIHTIANACLNTNGTVTAMIPSEYIGNYYITIRHRNHLETVTSSPVSFASIKISYNFTTSASQVYGNNQKQLATGIFGIFAGDVNQDGYVNVTDRSLVNSKVIAIDHGYIAEDVNGDGVINITDRSIVNSGVISIIHRSIP